MKYLRQEHGYAMLLVIFATLLISILGLGLLTMNANSLKTSKNEEVDQAVFYVAEAGINYYIEEINNLVEAAYQEVVIEYEKISNLTLKNNYPFENNFKIKANSKIKNYYLSNQPLKFNKFTSPAVLKYAQVKFSFVNDETINLISTGFIESKNRTISQTLKIKYNEFTKTKKTVIIDSSGNITSNNSPSDNNFLVNDPDFPNKTVIYTNIPLSKDNFKDMGVGKISGFNPNNLISLNDFNSQFNIPNNIKKVDAYANMSIKESMKINNFANALSGSSKIEIDATNNDLTIYIDSDFSPKIPFNIKGTKNVNIILINGMTLNEGFNLINNNGAEVNILVKGTANFNTGNGKDVLIQSNIIALESTFNLDSNKLKIEGNMITYTSRDININGSNHTSLNGLCAPYAKLIVRGTHNINGGSIVVNELHYNGQASFNYLGNNPPRNACTLPGLFNNKTTGNYYEYDKPNSLIKLETLIEN